MVCLLCGFFCLRFQRALGCSLPVPHSYGEWAPWPWSPMSGETQSLTIAAVLSSPPHHNKMQAAGHGQPWPHYCSVGVLLPGSESSVLNPVPIKKLLGTVSPCPARPLCNLLDSFLQVQNWPTSLVLTGMPRWPLRTSSDISPVAFLHQTRICILPINVYSFA